MEQLKKLFPNNVDTDYNILLETGARGIGKSLRLKDLVLTDKGYIKMGDITYDTKVYGDDGELHNVIGIYPQGKLDIYEVMFSDGVKTTCSLDHLWQVKDMFSSEHHHHVPKDKILPLKDILSKKLKQSNGYRFKLPLCNPINFPHRDVFIDPYIMGCLLGDGCIRKSISLTTMDNELADCFINNVKNNNHDIRICNNHHSKANSYYISPKMGEENIYMKELIKLNLYKTTSMNKFIPKQYLYNDVESRIALLQGLLDTDGTANKSPRRCDNTYSYNINYSTVSPQLKDDVV